MVPATRTLVWPLRSVLAARRPYATIPTKNPTPSGPIEPSRTQAHPIGAFYEAILNTPRPRPDVKPGAPAGAGKEENREQQPSAAAPAGADKETRERSRKHKAASSTAKPSVSSSSTTTTSSSSSFFSSSGSATTPLATATKSSTQEKAKVIFGSTLAGPAERSERLAQIRSRSTVVAGVLVPPKPEEPDNCCMSGCVNCVWERFRDEMEAWAGANAETKRRAAVSVHERMPEEGASAPSRGEPMEGPAADHTGVRIHDEGGGAGKNWDVGAVSAPAPASGEVANDFWDDELYKNVPVGIREFMKQEKKLKQKHMHKGTFGGTGAST